MQHELHSASRQWPQSNCSVDLWIEALNHWGFNPIAVMAFTVAIDYEGDQFTFYKIPNWDMEEMYGVQLLELSIYDDLERHVIEQVTRGRLVLVEVDGFFLPDTKGVTYQTAHKKTTIGIDSIDPIKGSLSYFHNDIYGVLGGMEYQHVMYKVDPPVLFPYVEFAKRNLSAPLPEPMQRDLALSLLGKHVRSVPTDSPIAAFRRAFQGHVSKLNQTTFHEFAFNHFRMLGSSFEYFGSFLSWLSPEDHAEDCRQIAKIAKLMQFKTLRMVARGRFESLEDQFDQLEANYNGLIHRLQNR